MPLRQNTSEHKRFVPITSIFKLAFILCSLAFFIFGITTTVHAATNVYYSVGQSSSNLMTGSPDVTIVSGTATFSVSQTGNIGVGDVVTYNTSNVAYISGKANANDDVWTLVTATGSIPANVTNATVNSIVHAFTSLSSAISGIPGANYLNNTSLVSAGVVVNIPCYYDSGPDTTNVGIPSTGFTTGPSNYINIYTPNNTSTQSNYSQRHIGKWTPNAYSLVVNSSTFAIALTNNYVRITGLQIELISSFNYQRVIYMDSITNPGGDVVLDSNILVSQATATGLSTDIIGENNTISGFTMSILNNIIYDTSSSKSLAEGIVVNANSSTIAIYNNTAYNTSLAYDYSGAAESTTYLKNNIAQDDADGYGYGTISASSTDNLSDQNDAPGTNPQNSATLNFISTSTSDFHLSPADTAAIGHGANLTSDPIYAFNYDINGNTRATSGAWNIGATEIGSSTPTIFSFGSSPEVISLGASSTLSWNIANASSVTISSGLLSTSTLVGSIIVNPTSTVTYTITATNGTGTSTASASVIISSLQNVYYSVGQSSSNLMTGSSTVTISSGAAVFSIAQTGNIGVGDAVTYNTSNVAYIASKTNSNDLDWSLVSATGSIPANISGATVNSITRAFTSLSGAISGMTGANYLNNTSLVSADVIVNLSCYYDTGPDTTAVSIGVVTGPSNYVNIYTPNNTSTQSNYSQRHTGKWTSTGAYQMVPTGSPQYAIQINSNYVRITGLEMKLVSNQPYQRGIMMDDVGGSGGYIVVDSNIVQMQETSGGGGDAIGANDPGAGPAVAILNNIIYDSNTTSSLAGIAVASGTYYIYNNTVYNFSTGYILTGTTQTTNIYAINNIAQDSGTSGYAIGYTINASSTDNLSDQDDAPGTKPENQMTVNFLSTSTDNFLLAPLNPYVIGQGANLSADPNHSFNSDIAGDTRPSGTTAWDIGADEYSGGSSSSSPPTITSFTMPATASSVIVAVNSFVTTSTVNPAEAYIITESSTAPSASSPSWQLSIPSSFAFGGSGTRTAYAYAMDAYGNISPAASASVTINPLYTAVSSSSSLPAGFFSMNWNNYLSGESGSVASPVDWPTVPFGGIRLWDNDVAWEEIETASGTYNWTGLNNWLAASAASGTDILYTFGRTPQWASANPGQTCNYGYGCAAPPSDVGSGDAIWKSFVTALVEHSLNSNDGHIKYYEIWNEPDDSGTWSGTPAQLVTMASDAYSIIHSLDPSAVVIGPGIAGNISWLSSYYAAGGASYQDATAFHAYVGANPNAVLNLTNNVRALMKQYSIGNEPLFVTEGSWGQNSTLTASQEAQYLAREYLYLWSENVSRYYWYSWDSTQWGTLWTSGGGINSAGTAYGLLDQWLVGSLSTSTPCSEDIDLTWSCNLTLADGDPAQILWNENVTTTRSVSPAFGYYETIYNNNQNSIVADTVTPGNSPIMIFGEQPSGSSPSISSFNASPGVIASAATSTLSWNITNASSVAITPGAFSTSTLIGSTTVNPTSTTIYTITATNSNGTSTATTTVQIAAVPSAPQSLSATPGNSQISLSWSAPLSNGSSSLTGYLVYDRFTGSSTFVLYATTTQSQTNATATSLANGQSYSFEILAENAIGTSTPSSIVSSTPYTVPNPPTSVSAVAGNASAVISFSAPASNGGSSITSYTATSNSGNHSASSTASPISIVGLTNGQPYTFTVIATNLAGNSASSSASNSVTPSGLDPSIVTFSASLSDIQPGASSTLSWTTTNASSVSIDQGVGSEAATSTGFVVVMPTSTATYTITATNGSGTSTRQATVIVDGIAPSIPIDLVANPLSTGEIDLSWASSTDNVGVEGYDIYQNSINIATTSSLFYANTGLSAGTSYAYTVDAFDLAGNISGESSSTLATTQSASTGGGGSSSGGGGGGGSSSGGGGGGGYFYPQSNISSSSTITSTATSSVETSLDSLTSIVTEVRSLSLELFIADDQNENLGVGSTGENVWALQVYLIMNNILNPTVSGSKLTNPTNYFGTLTENALAAYQENAGIIPASGLLGPKTRSYLVTIAGGSVTTQTQAVAQTPVIPNNPSTSFSSSLSLGDTGSGVASLQSALVKEGFLTRGIFISGVFDAATQRAVETFQCFSAIVCSGPAYGIVGPKTSAALGE
jgi:hypothetical protein